MRGDTRTLGANMLRRDRLDNLLFAKGAPMSFVGDKGCLNLFFFSLHDYGKEGSPPRGKKRKKKRSKPHTHPGVFVTFVIHTEL